MKNFLKNQRGKKFCTHFSPKISDCFFLQYWVHEQYFMGFIGRSKACF
ncbi:hypothetical protein [Polaromonas sp. CG9_12]|nr:hypothetical protein [Polaromonas sp. CG9_12]